MDEEVGDYESPYHPGDVKLEDRAVEGLRTLEELGWPLIVVSNQPAAAKGIVPLAELRAVHERVVELLAEEGIVLDDWRPTASIIRRVWCRSCRGHVPCRKPAPGMLEAAAEAPRDRPSIGAG